MSRSPQDVYARHLLSSRGYPLWIPEPSHELLIYRRDGLRIGDVGVVVPEDGGFEVFFNICLPREHPFHRSTGVPDNFRHIQLGDQDTRVIPNVEQPGRIISSSSVTRIKTVKPPSDSPSAHPGGLGYEFDLSSSGGALLVLPEGATRHELRNRQLFFNEATKHGIEWYRFAEENLGRMISHDSLYLITGFHKTRSWGLAAYENDLGSGEFSAQFKMTQVGGDDIAGTYTWETTRSLDWRVGPIENYGIQIPNQSVFIRGFRIALRTDVLGKRRVEVKVGSPNVDSNEEKFFDGSQRGSWISRLWKRLPRGGGHVGTDMQDEASGPCSGTEQASASDPPSSAPDDEGKHVVIEYMPESTQMFHPSDIINQYLLNEEPSASVAITHDDDWITLLEKGYLKPEDFIQVDPSGVEAVLFNNFHVLSEKGVASLQYGSGAGAATILDGGGINRGHPAPIVPDVELIAARLDEKQSMGEPEILASDSNFREETILDDLPKYASGVGQGSQNTAHRRYSPLDAEALPEYEAQSPSHAQPTEIPEKPDLLTEAFLAPTSGLHWSLLPYNPQTSKPLLRFDIILPVDQICYQHDHVREKVPEADLDAPASSEDYLTRMTITFEQWPFNWTIDVANPDGIRCRDVFQAIYASFNQQLTLGELSRVPDRRACDDAFRLRTRVLRTRNERALGWKRVDVLLHHTLFHGLTVHPKEQGWSLHLGAPLPVSSRAQRPNLSAPRPKVFFQVGVPEELPSLEWRSLEKEQQEPVLRHPHDHALLFGTSPLSKGTSNVITSPHSLRPLGHDPVVQTPARSRRGSESSTEGGAAVSSTDAQASYSLPTSVPVERPRLQTVRPRSRPNRRPLGARPIPAPQSGKPYITIVSAPLLK